MSASVSAATGTSRRALAKAADMGFTFYTHPEVEFFLLKDLPDDGTPPTPADTGGYFDLSTHLSLIHN